VQAVERRELKSRAQTTGKCATHASHPIVVIATKKSKRVRRIAQTTTHGESGLLVVALLRQ